MGPLASLGLVILLIVTACSAPDEGSEPTLGEGDAGTPAASDNVSGPSGGGPEEVEPDEPWPVLVSDGAMDRSGPIEVLMGSACERQRGMVSLHLFAGRYRYQLRFDADLSGEIVRMSGPSNATAGDYTLEAHCDAAAGLTITELGTISLGSNAAADVAAGPSRVMYAERELIVGAEMIPNGDRRSEISVSLVGSDGAVPIRASPFSVEDEGSSVEVRIPLPSSLSEASWIMNCSRRGTLPMGCRKKLRTHSR